MNLVGMDGMRYLESDDKEERAIMEHLLEITIDRMHQVHKSLAAQIGNVIGRMFK